MSAIRNALNILATIVDDGAYANLALKGGLGNVTDERDKRFISAVIYTTLEHLSYIDYLIGKATHGKINRTIRNILRLGICQIMFMERPDSAVCNECVSLSRNVGKSALSGYVNGVLRSVCRMKDMNDLPELPDNTSDRLAIETGFPHWFINEYIERFGEVDTKRILNAKEVGISIRAQFPYSTQMLIKYLEEKEIVYLQGELDRNIVKLQNLSDLSENELFKEGKITVQSEGSALVCMACGADKAAKLRVLDACAAPGGKSAYIASIAQNKCEIMACELHEHRVRLIENTFERLHISCAEVRMLDLSIRHCELVGNYDIVLCDVPCSGLGIVGKPDIRYGKDERTVDEIAKTQLAILDACADYAKDDGKIVYSTCTVTKRENEEVIAAFLAKHGDYELDISLSEDMPSCLRERAATGMMHVLPSIDGTEGFFIARLKRKGKQHTDSVAALR